MTIGTRHSTLEHRKLQLKISALVLTTVVVIAGMAAILVHERKGTRLVCALTDWKKEEWKEYP